MSKQYHPPTGAKPVLSAWAKATVKEFSEMLAAVPKERADIMSVKAEMLRELSERLRYIKEFERLDPRGLTDVVLKKDYKCVEVLEGHTGWVSCLQVLPDGRIVSGSDDRTIRIWSRGADGEWQNEVLRGHAGWIRCLQVLPDGRIVSGNRDGTLCIWSRGVDGAWQSEVLRGHSGSVNCLQVLPDGRIVSGGNDGTIRVWSRGVDGAWQSEVLEGHSDSVYCLQVHPDGRIFSGGTESVLRIWDGTLVGKAS